MFPDPREQLQDLAVNSNMFFPPEKLQLGYLPPSEKTSSHIWAA